MIASTAILQGQTQASEQGNEQADTTSTDPGNPDVAHKGLQEGAWTEAQRLIDEARAMLLARPETADPIVRAQALYAIEAGKAVGFNLYVAPRPDFPTFYSASVWSPFENTFGGPASDFVYQWIVLDGRRTYRIRGQRGSTRFADFQLFDAYWANPKQRSIGQYDVDRFVIGADGAFEVIASPDPQPGNWMRLDPAAPFTVIQVRDAFYDWASERGMKLIAEAIDGRPRVMLHDEATVAQRMIDAARFVKTGVTMALSFQDRVRARGPINVLYDMTPPAAQAALGASPRAGYGGMVYELGRDEALLIEGTVPAARYWSLQLTDLFWQTLDFSYHQSGLNGHQIKIDADGRFRAVLSRRDPGIANWIDPIDTPTGLVFMRTYDGSLAVPDVRRVRLADLAGLLPAGTARMTQTERAAQLSKRARASLGRWGY